MITRWTANVETIADIECIVFTNAKLGKYVTYEDHEKVINDARLLMADGIMIFGRGMKQAGIDRCKKALKLLEGDDE